MTPTVTSRTVPLAPAEAFALFTEDFGRWWPGALHSVSARKGQRPRRITLEPHRGGRIVEETHDGRREIWGRIIGWIPGEYLSFTWHPGAPEDEATVVSITFAAHPEGARVEVTQGTPDILGPLADAVSTAWLRGWRLALGCYSDTATARTCVREMALAE